MLTLWLPCKSACCASLFQHSGLSMAVAVSNATSKFPHSIAKSNRVFLSSTKCSAIYQTCLVSIIHNT